MKNQICPAAILLFKPGKECRLLDLFFGIPLLFLDLTLPPASPPRSRGLQRHLLSPSRGRAFHRGVQNENSNRTSGHQKKIERPRCPEVDLGILDFVVRAMRPAIGKHAKCIGFSCVFGTSRRTRRCRHTARSTGQPPEALFET